MVYTKFCRKKQMDTVWDVLFAWQKYNRPKHPKPKKSIWMEGGVVMVWVEEVEVKERVTNSARVLAGRLVSTSCFCSIRNKYVNVFKQFYRRTWS